MQIPFHSIWSSKKLIYTKLSVLDIGNASSPELGETDLELVMKYVSDLEKFDLVEY